MEKIIAIGGGEIKDLETLPIDKEIVRLTGKEHPRALFLPTASSDAASYVETFHQIYGEKLGCEADELLLVREHPTAEEIKNKILGADLIYVGGGNTSTMLKLWRQLGIDKLLQEACQKGTVLSGLSAGSICWFEYGHSDSKRFKNLGGGWDFTKIKGLGFLKGIHCPHYHKEGREVDFERVVGKFGGVGIALDNNTALEVVNGQYRIISSGSKSAAYRVSKKAGKAITEPIEKSDEFKPLSLLYSK